MSLRWRLFLLYLLPLAAMTLVLLVSLRNIAIGAANAHMADMASMMPGLVTDIEEAIAAGITQAVFIGLGLGIVVAITASFLVSDRLSSTFVRLSRASRIIAAGRYDERIDYTSGDEIGEMVGAFNEMAERLEETESLRRELLATISHELRTPLSNIQGYMEGLMDGVVPEDPATYQLVYREAGRLARLVQDVERLSRVEAGVEPPRPSLLPAGPLVSEVIERIRPLFQEREVALEKREAEGNLMVWADEDKLVQVLLSMLDNAVKHTPKSGRVTVTVEEGAGVKTGLRITDTGVGIPAEDLPHVFERFYRVDKSRSQEGGGTGIGLAVARSLVEQMGGTISATSTIGEGATFLVELPGGPPK